MYPFPPLKNLAGNDVAIFLYRFVLRGDDGIDFVMNEGIAADMYGDVNENLSPLVHACSETLLRYKHLSVTPEIMDGSILTTGQFEVMLSRGLGDRFQKKEKQELFNDAKRIADLLVEVMDRRTKEAKKGKHPDPVPDTSSRGSSPPGPPDPAKLKEGLQKLGEEKDLRDKAKWSFEGKKVRPGLRRLRPEDLPPGVTASRGYDQRGHCLTFSHETLGELGKIVLIPVGENRTMIHADFLLASEDPNSPSAKNRMDVFEKVVAVVNGGFLENFPE